MSVFVTLSERNLGSTAFIDFKYSWFVIYILCLLYIYTIAVQPFRGHEYLNPSPFFEGASRASDPVADLLLFLLEPLGSIFFFPCLGALRLMAAASTTGTLLVLPAPVALEADISPGITTSSTLNFAVRFTATSDEMEEGHS